MDVNTIITATFKKADKKTTKIINNSFPFKRGKVYTFKKWRAEKTFERDSVVVSFKGGDYHLPRRNSLEIIKYYEQHPAEKKKLWGSGIQHNPKGKLLFKKFQTINGFKSAIWISPNSYKGSIIEESSSSEGEEGSSDNDDDDDDDHDHDHDDDEDNSGVFKKIKNGPKTYTIPDTEEEEE